MQFALTAFLTALFEVKIWLYSRINTKPGACSDMTILLIKKNKYSAYFLDPL